MSTSTTLIVTCLTCLACLACSAEARAEAIPALSAQHRAILDACRADKLDKKPCSNTKLAASTTCRDAYAHIHTNEWHHNVWLPYIRGLRGAYVGVGSDQGLTFIAAARSQVAWMIDYDPNVVRINRVHRALILASKDRQAFLARWTKANSKQTLALLQKTYGDGVEARRIARTYRWARKTVGRYFTRMMRVGKRRSYHWLHSGEAYNYVRAMFRAGRIRILGGDLLKPTALTSIGAAARKLGIPIRVLYLSNAEEYWRYPKQFRANIKALHFDAKSVTLRTRTNKKGPTLGRYQYVVHAATHFQSRVGARGVSGVWSLLRDKRAARPKGLFVIGEVKRGASGRAGS
jgi:hypothetical protein